MKDNRKPLVSKDVLKRRFKRMIDNNYEDNYISVNGMHQLRSDKQPMKKWIRLGYFTTYRGGPHCSKPEKSSEKKQTYLKMTEKGKEFFSKTKV